MAHGTFSAVAARPSGWLASTDIVALVEGALAGFDPAEAAHLLAEVDEAEDQHGLPLEELAAGVACPADRPEAVALALPVT